MGIFFRAEDFSTIMLLELILFSMICLTWKTSFLHTMCQDRARKCHTAINAKLAVPFLDDSNRRSYKMTTLWNEGWKRESNILQISNISNKINIWNKWALWGWIILDFITKTQLFSYIEYRHKSILLKS
jgi:hypothetical protein